MNSALAVHELTPDLSAPRAQQALLDLHRTLEFGELWRSLQRLFETLLPHDTLVMSANYVDWRREATHRRLTSSRSRVTEDAGHARLVVDEGRNFFQPFLEKHAGIAYYQHTQLLPDPAKIPRTRYYQKYMLPLGWRYSAHLLFWREGGVETAFAIRRRAEQGDFTAGEMAALRAIHPHVGVAFERVREFETERQRRQLLESFYRAKPDAVLFFDWDLRVIFASEDAIEACAAWNLGAERARLYTPNAVFSVPVEISAACEEMKLSWRTRPVTASGARPPLTTLVEGSRTGFTAAVTLRRERGTALTKPVFIVRLRVPEELAIARADDDPLRRASERLWARLTPGERELARLVCAGLGNKEIAARLRRSVGSVKVQLSGAFAKLQLSSRAQMMVALR